MTTSDAARLNIEPQSKQPSTNEAEIVLRVAGLTKRYGQRTAVDGLDFDVRHGEVFGFLGPNGAGKTTAISMILGLITPDAGRVEILGHAVTDGDTAGLRRVGAIVETPAFYPYLSALDNLRVLAGVRGGVPASRFAEVLALVGLTGRERERFGAFSLGMKQRLGLAGVLLHEPALLILDEPSNGLDPAGIVEMRALILRLAREGQTIFLCSHLLAEVQQVCDRVLIIANGRSVAQGEVAALLRYGAQTILRVDDPQRGEVILRHVPWIESIAREGSTILLTMPDDHAPALGRLLAEHGLIVLEMRRHERDLEQLFLTITGDDDKRSA